MFSDHNKTAFFFDDRPVSYRDLRLNIGAFASRYRIKPGDRVAVICENRPEWIYAFFSAWANRGIAVPVDASLDSAAMSAIIKDCTPAVVFTSKSFRKTVQIAICQAGVSSDLIITDDPVPTTDSDLDINFDKSHTAVIVYTSGTTGAPKGVMLSFNNLLSNIRALQELKMFVTRDIIIGLLPFHHILPLQGTVIAPFFIGATVVYLSKLSPENILQALKRHQVTMFLGVPRLYELFHRSLMEKLDKNYLAKLIFRTLRIMGSQRLAAAIFHQVHQRFGGHVRAYLTGGAPMDPHIARDLTALGFKLVEGYGLSETSPLLAFNRFDAVRIGSVGQALPGSEIKIIKNEIVVRGPNIMQGYWQNPAATAAVIRDGWLHTGDTGHIDRKGYLFIDGRKDEMIVLDNGKNIDPEKI